ASRRLSPTDKARFFAYATQLLARQRGDLHLDVRYDDVSALDELAPIGPTAREQIIRPLFEGPFFSRLEEMSGALVRSWLRVLSVGAFFHVDGGMDAPWRYAGDVVSARTDVTVERVTTRDDGRVEVH